MTIYKKWLSKAQFYGFVFSIAYMRDRVHIIIRKGPTISWKAWERIKPQLFADGFEFDERFGGWHIPLNSIKLLRAFFPPTR